MKSNIEISIIMALWRNDNPCHFRLCLDSIALQSNIDYEVIIVSDGPVTDSLIEVIESHRLSIDGVLKYLCLAFKGSPAYAWNEGVKLAKADVVARMDPDDLMVEGRLRLQVDYMMDHPEVGVCGGQIIEFDHEVGDLQFSRRVSLLHNEILINMKRSNPINHVTVVCRKSIFSLEEYIVLFQYVDYYLWVRLIKHGVVFHNLDKILCYVRTGNQFGRRRTGIKYLSSDIEFSIRSLKLGVWGVRDVCLFLIPRFFVRLLPPVIVEFIYKLKRRRDFYKD